MGESDDPFDEYDPQDAKASPEGSAQVTPRIVPMDEAVPTDDARNREWFPERDAEWFEECNFDWLHADLDVDKVGSATVVHDPNGYGPVPGGSRVRVDMCRGRDGEIRNAVARLIAGPGGGEIVAESGGGCDGAAEAFRESLKSAVETAVYLSTYGGDLLDTSPDPETEGGDPPDVDVPVPESHPDSSHPFNDDDFAWTEGQERAITEAAEAFNEGGDSRFGVFGPAGTGKTASVQMICRMFEGNAVMTAPTHKAAGVLSEMAASSPGIEEATTIHSLLNMRKVRKGSNEEFRPKGGSPPDIGYGLVVVDECSMIDSDLWEWIEMAQKQSFGEVNLLLLGDPYQLPPVDESGSKSPTFDVPHVELDEIVRHGGVVKETADEVRRTIGRRESVFAREGSDHASEIRTYGGRDEWLEAAAEAMGEDGVRAKAAAFTNEEVESLNSRIRSLVEGPDAPRFKAGDTLVAVETFEKERDDDKFFDEGREKEILLWTQDRCLVKAAERTEHEGIPCWWLRIETNPHMKGEASIEEAVHAVTLDQSEELDAKLSRMARLAKDDDSDVHWGMFWDLKDEFARLRLPYATTVHKLQGSTLDEVYVQQNDIRDCHDRSVQDRLLYVAYSRAESELHVYDPIEYGDVSGADAGDGPPVTW